MGEAKQLLLVLLLMMVVVVMAVLLRRLGRASRPCGGGSGARGARQPSAVGEPGVEEEREQHCGHCRARSVWNGSADDSGVAWR